MATHDDMSPKTPVGQRVLQSPNAWRVLVLLFAASGVTWAQNGDAAREAVASTAAESATAVLSSKTINGAIGVTTDSGGIGCRAING